MDTTELLTNPFLFGSTWGESSIALANGELSGKEKELAELRNEGFLGLFNQARVFVLQFGARNRAAHLLAYERKQRDLFRGVVVLFAVMHIDDADHFATRDERELSLVDALAAIKTA